MTASTTTATGSSSSKRNAMLGFTIGETELQKFKKARSLNLDDLGLDRSRLRRITQVQPLVKRRRTESQHSDGQSAPGLGKPGSLGIKPYSDSDMIAVASATEIQPCQPRSGSVAGISPKASPRSGNEATDAPT